MFLITLYYISMGLLVIIGTFNMFLEDVTSFIVFALGLPTWIILGICVIIYGFMKPSKEKTKNILLAVIITSVLLFGGYRQLRIGGVHLYFKYKTSDLEKFRKDTENNQLFTTVFADEHLQRMTDKIDGVRTKGKIDDFKKRISEIGFAGYVDTDNYTLFVHRWSGIDNVIGFLYQKEDGKLPMMRSQLFPGCILVNLTHIKDRWFYFGTT